MTEAPNNMMDIIDSRNVIERLEELEGLFEDLSASTPLDTDDTLSAGQKTDLTAEEEEEYKALKALADEASGYAPDWQHAETLIRDSYFVEYAEELASDIAACPNRHCWPCRHINWEAAAEDLKQDYTAIDFDGVTYWIR